jgi:hypothetical protein
MKINYPLVKKIHLYACLSTVAILAMFIFTSYLMIHHDWFDNAPVKDTIMVRLDENTLPPFNWETWTTQYNIEGRLVRENTNSDGHPVREYASAALSTRITLIQNENQAEIVRTVKSNADAIVGIHRIRGYGGPFIYNVYALFLDLVGISLIVFVVSGIIMWFKLLKNNRIAWIIFVSGLIYFMATMVTLIYW